MGKVFIALCVLVCAAPALAGTDQVQLVNGMTYDNVTIKTVDEKNIAFVMPGGNEVTKPLDQVKRIQRLGAEQFNDAEKLYSQGKYDDAAKAYAGITAAATLDSKLVQVRRAQAKAQAMADLFSTSMPQPKPSAGPTPQPSPAAGPAATQPRPAEAEPALVSPDALFKELKTSPVSPDNRPDWTRLTTLQQQAAMQTYRQTLVLWQATHNYNGKAVSWPLKLHDVAMSDDDKWLKVTGISPQGHLVSTTFKPAEKDKWMKIAKGADILLEGCITDYQIGGVLSVTLGSGKGMFGADIEADNIIILLDTTGSMQATNMFGVGKKGVQQFIESLNESRTFNVVVDSDASKPSSYSKAAVPAVANEKAKVRKYLAGLVAGGKGNAAAAIDLAIKNVPAKGTTCICYVTDGDLPSPEAAIRKFAQLNAGARKVPIHMFVMGKTSNKSILDMAREIADDSGGVFKQVEQ